MSTALMPYRTTPEPPPGMPAAVSTRTKTTGRWIGRSSSGTGAGMLWTLAVTLVIRISRRPPVRRDVVSELGCLPDGQDPAHPAALRHNRQRDQHDRRSEECRGQRSGGGDRQAPRRALQGVAD